MRRLIVCLLILSSFPAFSQQSSEPSKSSMICFTESELEAMENEAAQIMEDAVTEAVTEAVKPYEVKIDLLSKDLAAARRATTVWMWTGIGMTVTVTIANLLIYLIKIAPRL